MAKVFLVNGLFVHDSGKTWFSITLARYLTSEGFKVGMYKPVAGHSAWTQFHTVDRSKELKLLVGSDVLTYFDSGLVRSEELTITNPVDLLMAPLDVLKYLNSEAFHRYVIDAFDQFKQLVMARITDCSQGSSTHFVINNNLNRLTKTLRDYLKELSNTLGAKDISLEDLIAVLRSQWIEENLNVCLKRVCEDRDIVIVESFNDAFTPYPSLLGNIDRVILIAQGRAVLFDDLSSIKTLLHQKIITMGDEGLKSINVLGKLTPSLSFDIAPGINIESTRIAEWGSLIKALNS